MKRRVFLKGAMTGAAIAASVPAGLLVPRRVIAQWPAEAFGKTNFEQALAALLGDVPITSSEAIRLTAPDLAENGATVEVGVATELNAVDSITIFSEKNPFPLIASFSLTPAVHSRLTTRIKMAGVSDVIAIIRADGRYYSARKRVRVTAGGCN